MSCGFRRKFLSKTLKTPEEPAHVDGVLKFVSEIDFFCLVFDLYTIIEVSIINLTKTKATVLCAWTPLLNNCPVSKSVNEMI